MQTPKIVEVDGKPICYTTTMIAAVKAARVLGEKFSCPTRISPALVDHNRFAVTVVLEWR